MVPNSLGNESILHSQRTRLFMVMCIFLLAICLPSLAMAFPAGADESACGTISGFAKTVQSLLNGISIVVVTIAVIFSGYQIAFAHKRIGDVAPVLIGAVLIGAAGQIAKMFLGGDDFKGTDCATTFVVHALNYYA